MKYLFLLTMILVSVKGYTQNSPDVLNRERARLSNTASIMGLDSTNIPKLRIWNNFYVFEIILDKNNYKGSVNFYFDWFTKDTSDKQEGFECKRIILDDVQYIQFSTFFLDTLNISERIKKDKILPRLSDCDGYIEYFAKDGSIYFAESSIISKATLHDCKIFNSYENYFRKFINEDQEMKGMLKQIKIDQTIECYSNTTCCCGLTYTPEGAKKVSKTTKSGK